MGQVRQAKILCPKQEAAALQHFATTRQLVRDQAMFLLSVKTGGRAKPIYREAYMTLLQNARYVWFPPLTKGG